MQQNLKLTAQQNIVAGFAAYACKSSTREMVAERGRAGRDCETLSKKQKQQRKH